jgi:TatD DNase family protein
MIDSHCHIDFSQFDCDRAEVASCAKALGVNTILIPGTRARDWPKQISLATENNVFKFALGLHPYFLDEYQAEHLLLLDELLHIHQTQVVAVGEIGLDKAISISMPLQQQLLQQQFALANKHNLPVILHHRQSHNELIRCLKSHPVARGGVVHAFSGSLQEAHTYIELGFKLGVGGVITYPRAQKTRNVIAQLPLDSLLLETDAPDMPLSGRQGKRNSPEYLPEVLEALSQLRPESKSYIEQVTTDNFNELFNSLVISRV